MQFQAQASLTDESLEQDNPAPPGELSFFVDMRLLTVAILSLVLLAWIAFGGLVISGAPDSRTAFGYAFGFLGAAILSCSSIVIAIPVLLRGTSKQRLGALLALPFPLSILLILVRLLV
jgi:hypothetical protein